MNKLFINELHLKNFRIHQNINFKFNKNIIFFIGNNAIGKTSILESIYYLALTKSNRTKIDQELIKFNEKFSLISLKESNNNYKIVISNRGKSCFINDKEINKLSDYIGNLYVIFSSKEDFKIINGSPNIRRYFLNLEISILDKTYLDILRKYNDILKDRNNLLKEKNIDYNYLDILDEQLTQYGIIIINKRNNFLKELNNYLNLVYKDIYNKESIKLIYKNNIDINNYLNILKEKRDLDIQTSFTNYGPHRDDFELYLNDLEINKYSSEGQKKLFIINLRIALLKYLEDKININPILLLDDVFSDLDIIRQNNLIKYLNNNQTFITSTTINNLDNNLLSKSQVFIYDKIWKEK